ncbi:hypothetical protein HGO21_08225 [Acinetobacter sp. CUI P1]|nr:hypothetical protein [Acinetobacter sp. CUI P1]
MSMTDKQFDEYLNFCYENLEIKQKVLIQDYKIGEFHEYWYDQESSKLQFKSDGNVMLEFSVVFIGSWSNNSNTWMWAWANNSMTNGVKKTSSILKELTSITGSDIFTKECFECDEIRAHELTAMSVEHLQAKGMYISPSDNSKLFLALIQPIN